MCGIPLISAYKQLDCPSQTLMSLYSSSLILLILTIYLQCEIMGATLGRRTTSSSQLHPGPLVPAHPARLLLLGDAETGKSCFVKTLAKCDFCVTYEPTIGVEFRMQSVCLDGTNLKLEIFNAAGQEKMYRVFGFRFFRSAEGIIVVYDATRQETFDNVPNWIEEVREHEHPDAPVVLIGNKCDLTDKKVVGYQTAKDFADKHNCIFFEVSAKDGTNTELALMSLVARIREKHCQSEPNT